jgi:hypothetical protein
MASQNNLLGSGKPNEEIKKVVKMSKRIPVLMYHESCMGGQLVKDEKVLDKLIALGWLDHPGKVKRLKGHEKVFDEYQKALKKPEQKPDEGKGKVEIL